MIEATEPIQAAAIRDALIASNLTGADFQLREVLAALPAKRLDPSDPLARFGKSNPRDPKRLEADEPPDGGWLKVFWPDDDPPLIRFPKLEAAANRLSKLEIFTPGDFYSLAANARQQAFTISGGLSRDSIAKIRDNLSAELIEGPSLRTFTARVKETLGEIPLRADRLEQVYRNAVNESYSQGMESVLGHHLVDKGFPYRMIAPVKDARARHEHLVLAFMGLNGTAIYHKDDPTWLRFRPPWAWGCRCGWVAISIETAASMGVKEAQRWLKTGLEPVHRWVTPPKFSPPPGWDRAALAVGV